MKPDVWERLKAHHAKLIHGLPSINRSMRKRPVIEYETVFRQTEIELDDTAAPHSEPKIIDYRPQGHKLVSAGRRVPQGGAEGDTYSHYAWMNASTRSDRDRLFMVAHVCPKSSVN
jgi:hypothetical protein